MCVPSLDPVLSLDPLGFIARKKKLEVCITHNGRIGRGILAFRADLLRESASVREETRPEIQTHESVLRVRRLADDI